MVPACYTVFMEWLEIRIETTDEGVEPVYALLDAMGVYSVSVEESVAAMEAQLQCSGIVWDYAETGNARGNPCVVGYVASLAAEGLQDALRVALVALPARCPELAFGSLALSFQIREESSWENNWKQYYKPFPVGERLLVRPEWEEASPGTRIELIIDPGMAFGTGSHETTRMCLEFLDAIVRVGDSVLDLGCGSGILSIAAKKLGAARVTAVDIDPVATAVTRENMQRNGIAELELHCGNILTDAALLTELSGAYDLIVSNIVADVVIALAPIVRQNLRAGGTWISSGVIGDREGEVLAAFAEQDFRVAERRADGEWCAYLCRNK